MVQQLEVQLARVVQPALELLAALRLQADDAQLLRALHDGSTCSRATQRSASIASKDWMKPPGTLPRSSVALLG